MDLQAHANTWVTAEQWLDEPPFANKRYGRDGLKKVIGEYVSYFSAIKCKLRNGAEGHIVDYVSGSVFRLKMLDGAEKMCLLENILFERKALDGFMMYLKNLYTNHCFGCRHEVNSHFDEKCPHCGWYICSNCGECGCNYRGFCNA